MGPRGQPRDAQRPRAHGLRGLQDLPGLREADLRAAVTGPTGFVGSHLVAALAARGDTVTALVRPGRGRDASARRAVLAGLGCRLVEGTLEEASALRGLVDGRDVVFHVAGLVAARSEADFMRVNRDGVQAVTDAAREVGVGRLLLVSSLAVSGPSRPGSMVSEASGPGPVTAYGRSKQAGEEAARASSVPLTIVRPPAVYGPRDRAFLALFRAAARGVVPLLGSGAQELTLVHAGDLARALVLAATSASTLGGTYHAGNPRPVSQRELAAAAGRAVGRAVRYVRVPGVLVRFILTAVGSATRAVGGAPFLDGDKANELLAPGWSCSSEALRRDAGWAAEVSLEEGLAETVRSHREAGWL